jgi:hypothetical protein
MHFSLYLLALLTDDEDLISHVNTLALAKNDDDGFIQAKYVAEKRRNGMLEYMEYLLSIVIIG